MENLEDRDEHVTRDRDRGKIIHVLWSVSRILVFILRAFRSHCKFFKQMACV